MIILSDLSSRVKQQLHNLRQLPRTNFIPLLSVVTAGGHGVGWSDGDVERRVPTIRAVALVHPCAVLDQERHDGRTTEADRMDERRDLVSTVASGDFVRVYTGFKEPLDNVFNTTRAEVLERRVAAVVAVLIDNLFMRVAGVEHVQDVREGRRGEEQGEDSAGGEV